MQTDIYGLLHLVEYFNIMGKFSINIAPLLTLQAFVTMLPCSSIFQRKGNFMFLPSLAHPCITMTGVFAQSLKRVNIHTDETGDGRVFLSVADNGTSIYEYTPSTNAHIKRMAGFSMDIDMNNRLWVWHTGEICCYSTTDFSRVKGIPVDGQLYTSCLIPNGLLAYFTSLGVIFVNTSTLDIEKNVSTSRVVTKLQGKRINRAKRYDNTSMILFGDDGKLYWFDVSGMNVIAQNEAGFPFASTILQAY